MSEKHPFDLIDLGLLLFVAPLHPLALGAVVAQWFVRRSPAIVGSAAELMQAVGVPALPPPGRARDAIAALLPAAALLPERAQPDQPDQPALLPAPADGPLTLGDWLDLINDQPDKVPHLACTGPSGSGKTTLILAALSRRPGRLVVCTPKSRRDDPWGGITAIRLRKQDMSFVLIANAILAVHAEMLRRNTADDDAPADEWLTLVVDEYSTVIGKMPELKETVLDLVTMGRSVRIRVVLLATETNVKAWGWEGRGEARHNVLFVECEEDTRRAVAYRWGKTRRQLDTRAVYPLAQAAILAGREWRPARRPDPAADAGTLAALLGLDLGGVPANRWTGTQVVPAHQDAVPGAVPGTGSQDAGTGSPDDAGTGFDRDLADALIAAGWSANKIYGKVGGKRAAVLAYVRERRGGAENLDEPGGDVPPAFRNIK
jgi:hypothetical protein